MKVLRIITILFFATALSASAQLPAKRTMPKKVKTEATASQADNGSDKEIMDRAKAKAAIRTTAPDNEAKGKPAPQKTTTPPAAKTAPAEKPQPAPTAAKRPTGGRPTTANTTPMPPQGGSYRDFPTAATMPDDAAWRRDVYRTLDLTKEKNAVLYFPIVPSADRQNLFVYLFRQVLRGNIKAYEYTLDANEHFDEAHQLKGKKIMDTHNIYYEEVDAPNGKKSIRVNDADLPSEDVKLYFVKENVYYDQHTASFRTKITALCPVMVSGTNDFGEDETQRVPLFWVNYEEAAPYLAKLSLMGSSINNAAVISADDYFTMNRYEGDIYKTTNLQDRIIAQYTDDEDAQHAERKRIEGELTTFEKHVWGHEPERLLDTYGNPVLDGEGKPITYNNEGQLIDSRGRRIAFTIAGKDSLNVASEHPEVEPLPAIVLLNERGYAVDADGQPLLKADGSPITTTDEYPTPEALANETKKSNKNNNTSATTRRTTATSDTTTRRTTTNTRTTAKTSSNTKAASPKTTTPKPKAVKTSKAPKATNGTISVRKERH